MRSSHSPPEEPEMQIYDAHKSTTEVRQGSRRKMNLRVLIISTVLVVVAFAIILLVFNAMAPGTAS
jgi:disulfide bond formation protein DsbB